MFCRQLIKFYPTADPAYTCHGVFFRVPIIRSPSKPVLDGVFVLFFHRGERYGCTGNTGREAGLTAAGSSRNLM